MFNAPGGTPVNKAGGGPDKPDTGAAEQPERGPERPPPVAAKPEAPRAEPPQTVFDRHNLPPEYSKNREGETNDAHRTTVSDDWVGQESWEAKGRWGFHGGFARETLGFRDPRGVALFHCLSFSTTAKIGCEVVKIGL